MRAAANENLQTKVNFLHFYIIMKLITFAVPSYNSQDYLKTCVDSLLVGGEDVEILIINDGSTDNTAAIADEYQARYPSIVRAVHKPNGGHGSGVNKGLELATGLYYKVVDSDDWLDADALNKLLSTIRAHLAADTLPDLYIVNFVYDKPSAGKQHVSSYEKKMPQDEFFGWEKVKPFRFSHMLLMHSLVYKREPLVASNTVLPEHTFYVDDIFAYKPMPFMNKLYYLNIDLYHYFIGRSDQSITKANFSKRYDQQIRVMRTMADSYKWEEIVGYKKGLRKYMWHALEVIMMVTIYFVSAVYAPEKEEALKELWAHIKKNDKKLYNRLRLRSYCTSVVFLPRPIRAWIMDKSYSLLCNKIYLG